MSVYLYKFVIMKKHAKFISKKRFLRICLFNANQSIKYSCSNFTIESLKFRESKWIVKDYFCK